VDAYDMRNYDGAKIGKISLNALGKPEIEIGSHRRAASAAPACDALGFFGSALPVKDWCFPAAKTWRRYL
jgi:hypothetical protein